MAKQNSVAFLSVGLSAKTNKEIFSTVSEVLYDRLSDDIPLPHEVCKKLVTEADIKHLVKINEKAVMAAIASAAEEYVRNNFDSLVYDINIEKVLGDDLKQYRANLKPLVKQAQQDRAKNNKAKEIAQAAELAEKHGYRLAKK